MAKTLIKQAEQFLQKYLFLFDPEGPHPNASVALARAVTDWMEIDEADPTEWRVRQRVMMRAAARMMEEGLLFAELSRGGVVFVRLTPEGVLVPTGWSSLPAWFAKRPDLVAWAEHKQQKEKQAG